MKKTQRIMIVILLGSAIFPFVATDHLLSAERAGKLIPVRIAVVSPAFLGGARARLFSRGRIGRRDHSL